MRVILEFNAIMELFVASLVLTKLATLRQHIYALRTYFKWSFNSRPA